MYLLATFIINFENFEPIATPLPTIPIFLRGNAIRDGGCHNYFMRLTKLEV